MDDTDCIGWGSRISSTDAALHVMGLYKVADLDDRDLYPIDESVYLETSNM